MKADDCCLLVIDVQERLLPAMSSPQAVLARGAVLMKAAARLRVPILVSEQYPRGLGRTAPELAALAPEGSVLEKVHFSCAEVPEIVGRLKESGRRQVVVFGMEAHVCVLQSVLRLAEIGFDVFVAADACSSRSALDADLAFQRMRANRVEVVSTEMVVFEWLRCAGTAEFKELSALIK